jgi:hypothetical protein
MLPEYKGAVWLEVLVSCAPPVELNISRKVIVTRESRNVRKADAGRRGFVLEFIVVREMASGSPKR